MKNEETITDTGQITTDKETIVLIEGLYKSFGEDNPVLKGVTLSVKAGENLVLLGRSGSGKSIIIKCIAGLIAYDKGSIQVMGTEINALTSQQLNELRLKMGFLFQNAALYDSMTVRENLAFPLKRHSPEKTEQEITAAIVAELESVGLAEAIDKMPSELSGGMRKRVGLARTLILNPLLMLYDEPTTGLDTITSREISELILRIQQKNKTSSIIITHDMACARLTGDRIVILENGIIHAEGTYDELAQSKDTWVGSFFT